MPETPRSGAGRRVRFAPSPTGALHLGAVRTALFNWLVARGTGGAFILRIEDTDQGRFVPGSEAQIVESLGWLGLAWDEGPQAEAGHGPYVQSLRTRLYAEHAERLAASGAAYWCTCSAQRLELMRADQQRRHLPTRYDRRCLGRQAEVAAERAAGTPAVLRLRMPEGRTEWDDLVRGPIAFDNADIDDQVLLKSDGFPTYHLAHVVDDHLMEISHVLRSDEWIPSTPKHLATFAALGWAPPAYAHLPVVLGEDGRKLSKRRGARNVLDYRDLGYLPAAVVNAMALLGWSAGTTEELFTPAELVERFSLERVHPAGAVFDAKRLDALQGQHIRRLSADDLATALEPWLPDLDRADRLRLVPLLQERIVTLADARSLVEPMLDYIPWPADLEFPPKKVDTETALSLLDATTEAVESGGLEDVGELRARLTTLLEARGVRARDGFRVLYIAMYGSPVGLPVFDAMAFIGAERTAERLRHARARIRS